MKLASGIAERVEEYRYHSGSIGNVRKLTIHVLALRLKNFFTVTARAAAAARKAGGSSNSKSNRRRFR